MTAPTPVVAACRVRRRPVPGFTLIELAIVLAIVALVLRLAAPGLARATAQRALAAQVAEFMGALRFARAQALQRGAPVSICAAARDGLALACQGPGPADWRFGWIVFADPGRRGDRAVGDPLLRVQQPLQRSGGVAGTRRSLSYTAAGYSTDAASHFLFSPASGAADSPPALLVCVSKQGRPRLAATEGCS